MRSLHCVIALALLALGAATGMTVAAPDPLPSGVIDELRAAVAAGRCTEVTERIDALPRSQRGQPDVLVLEANCVATGARRTERVFVQDRHDRAIVGGGARPLPPAVAEEFYRVDVTRDDARMKKAVALFDRALAAAPTRSDIVTGAIALHAIAGDAKGAAAIIAARRDALLPDWHPDVRRVVQDEIALGNIESARTIASAFATTFPDAQEAAFSKLLVALAARDTDAALAAWKSIKTPSAEMGAPIRALALRLLLARRWTEAIPVLLPFAGRDLEATTWLALARERTAPGSSAPIWRSIEETTRNQPSVKHVRQLADHYQRILADRRPVTEAMHTRAIAYFDERKLPIAAVAEADAAFEASPESASAWAALAEVYRGEGRYDLALDAVVRALGTATPEARPALVRARGELLYATGDDRAAAVALDEAAAAGAPAPFARGLAALAQGDAAKARASFEAAVAAAGPDADRAKGKLALLDRAAEGS